MRRLPAIVLVGLIAATSVLVLSLGLHPGSGGSAGHPAASPSPAGRAEGSVRILVVVDNNPYRGGLETAWGLSIYVEAGSVRFLFDTGPDPGVLERNAERLGVNLSAVDFVVISHVHGDHTGGLKLISRVKPGLKVYVPASDEHLSSYVRSLGLKPIPVNRTTMIAPGVYVIKPLYGPPWEEAVAVATDKGLVVLVGCSHPGADRLAEEAIRDTGLKPYAILGGFHLLGSPQEKVARVTGNLVSMGFKKIYPIHCSGQNTRKYLEKHYPQTYGDGGVGLELVLHTP